jgi:hypothetical protein
MATNQRNKQKRLEQKRAKRKAAQKKQSQRSGSPGVVSLQNLSALPNAPIHECWISNAIFENGMGPVAISRRMANGDIAFGVFLLDVYCLGVKNCLFNIKSEYEYDDFFRQYEGMYDLEKIHQTCAKKIIEGAVEYSNSLGFKPHKDYKRDKLIIGDSDTSLCPSSYEYGMDGKPCYIPGPDDSPSRQRSIMNQLNKVLGSDKFNFIEEENVQEEFDYEDGQLSSFVVTDEPTIDKYSKRITDKIQKKINELYNMVFEQPVQAIPILEDLVKKHPGVVQFSNYLSSAYSGIGDEENAKRVVLELYKKEPDYLFAKINYADICMQDGDLDKVSEIFEDKYDLQEIYPDRDEFHVSEALGFSNVMCWYFIHKGDTTKASRYFDMMENIEPDHPSVMLLKQEF